MKYEIRKFDTPRQWELWRNEGIGASDMPVIMGYSGFKSRSELLQEKQGIRTPKAMSNWFRQKCRDSEEMAVMDYNSKYGCDLVEVNIENVANPDLRASLDGLSSDRKTLLEHKLVDRITYASLLEYSKSDLCSLRGLWNRFPEMKVKGYVSQIIQQLIVMGIRSNELSTVVLSLGNWHNPKEFGFLIFDYDDDLVRFARSRASYHARAADAFLKEWKGQNYKGVSDGLSESA